MFLTLLSQLTTLLMAGVCAWALLGGRWPERITAIAYALDWLGSALGEDRRPNHHGQPIIMVLDLAFLVLLLVLTASCRRAWLLWMSACSLLVVLTHLAMLMDPSFGQWTYETAYYIWSLGALLAFTLGMATEGRKPVHWLIHIS